MSQVEAPITSGDKIVILMMRPQQDYFYLTRTNTITFYPSNYTSNEQMMLFSVYKNMVNIGVGFNNGFTVSIDNPITIAFYYYIDSSLFQNIDKFDIRRDIDYSNRQWFFTKTSDDKLSSHDTLYYNTRYLLADGSKNGESAHDYAAVFISYNSLGDYNTSAGVWPWIIFLPSDFNPSTITLGNGYYPTTVSPGFISDIARTSAFTTSKNNSPESDVDITIEPVITDTSSFGVENNLFINDSTTEEKKNDIAIKNNLIVIAIVLVVVIVFLLISVLVGFKTKK